MVESWCLTFFLKGFSANKGWGPLLCGLCPQDRSSGEVICDLLFDGGSSVIVKYEALLEHRIV